ncbi:hypothetical protein HYALB_00000909 [Hymenoscyphus albidus]|uniref:Uncharacterized protein n=1 Tax=Hymenoscyphus albidus TaxID=595503 RepID=A0A9N9LEL4_9HELO|nr:hypothetical protein HYALB_00000909 [Hymenoscyphus albidus]
MEIYHTTFEESHGRGQGGWSTSPPPTQQKSSLQQHLERKRQLAEAAEKERKKVGGIHFHFLPSFGSKQGKQATAATATERKSEPEGSQYKIPRKAVPIRKCDIRMRDERGGLGYPVAAPGLKRKGGFRSGSDGGVEEKTLSGEKREDGRRQVSPPRSSNDLSSATSSPFYAHRLGYQAPAPAPAPAPLAPTTRIQNLRRCPSIPEIPRSEPKAKPTSLPAVTSPFKPLPRPPRPVNNNDILLDARNNYKSLPAPITPWPNSKQQQLQKQIQRQHQNVKTHEKKKSESASKRLVEYIHTSADFFDETRRGVQGILSPGIGPQDHTSHSHEAHNSHPVFTPSYSGGETGKGASTPTPTRENKPKSKPTKRDPADSILSFYCAGTPSFPILSPKYNSNTPTPATLLPNNQLLNPQSAIKKTQYYSPSPGSVEKLTSATDVEPRICRLCKVGLEGIMGLCVKCEAEFSRPSSGLRPQTEEVRNPTPPPKDEVRPPAPLKVFKTASMGPDARSSHGQTQTRTSTDSWTSLVESLTEGETSRPRSQRSPSPTWGRVAKGRTVIQSPAVPGRQNSHRVVIMDAEEDEERYSRYQSDGMRTDAERRRNDLTSWTNFYDDQSQVDYDKKIRTPETANKYGDRDTNFYDFYDDILG